jgi:hypothetical protein
VKYARRDFLKALGIGAAAAVVAPEILAADPFIPAGGRIAVQIPSPEYFPWAFYGENDFPPCRFGCPADPVEHDLIDVEEPPEGFQFIAHGMKVGINDNVALTDLERFLETWKIRVYSGSMMLIEAHARHLMTGWGVLGSGLSELPFWPSVGLDGRTLRVSAFGKPFRLQGKQLLLFASIYGIGCKAENTITKTLAQKLPQ